MRLQTQKAWLLKHISQHNLLPSETGHDGFHASLLEKL